MASRDSVTVATSTTCTGRADYNLAGAADGTYTFTVDATDAAGNTGAPTTGTYVLDTTPPAAPSITGSPLAAGADRHPGWTLQTEPSATTACSLTGRRFA